MEGNDQPDITGQTASKENHYIDPNAIQKLTASISNPFEQIMKDMKYQNIKHSEQGQIDNFHKEDLEVFKGLFDQDLSNQDEDSDKQEGEEKVRDSQNQKQKSARSSSDESGVSDQQSRSRSHSKSRHKKKKTKYITKTYYCCGRCQKNDQGGKTCICVVPAQQRQGTIGNEGCQTCGCPGCSREDFMLRGETSDEYKDKEKQKDRERDRDRDRDRSQEKEFQQKDRSFSRSKSRDNYDQDKFQMKNGCCQKCLKAFSKTGQACLCQVPSMVRKTELPKDGCKYCGCQGCNPQDTRGENASAYIQEQNKRAAYQKRSRSRSQSISDSSSDDDDDILNLNNFDKSSIGSVITSQLNVYPPLIGFGIPQRTFSYIMGKPQR